MIPIPRNTFRDALHAGDELSDLGRVLLAARAFHAARHVHAPRPHEADRTGYVVGMEAARKHDFGHACEATRLVPVGELAAAALRALEQ